MNLCVKEEILKVVNLLSCSRATLSKVKVLAVVEVAFGMKMMKNALIAVLLVTAALTVCNA